jgi:hypothetical protein
MRSDSSPKLASDEVIRRLQETLLGAVLMGRPLPGSNQPTSFPDFSFIERQPVVYLAEENLSGAISVEGLPKPLRILPRDELLKEARAHGDLTYLYFHPPVEEGGALRFTLEAKIIPQNPEHHALGLSGLQVKFHQADGRWETTSDHGYFAT